MYGFVEVTKAELVRVNGGSRFSRWVRKHRNDVKTALGIVAIVLTRGQISFRF